jgi:predicted nucleic acid-binding protein
MIPRIFDSTVFIDTSAVLALHEPAAQFHVEARRLFSNSGGLQWAALDLSAHEVFTRVRYDCDVVAALEQYNFLRNNATIRTVRFEPSDESHAESIVSRYAEHKLSFHDAICAAAMKRLGVGKVFSFDRDFAVLGFIMVPGTF